MAASILCQNYNTGEGGVGVPSWHRILYLFSQ